MKKYENCVFDSCPVTNGLCDKKCKCPNDSKTKLVGIACDRYKVNKFTKTLNKKGFPHFQVTEGKVFDIIKVAAFSKDMPKLKRVIETIEQSFK